LTLSLKCRPDAGTFVGDGLRLQQVLYNLLANAFEHTPRGGTSTLAGAIDGDDVKITGADTGAGVAVEVMPTAFERFSAKGAPGEPGGRGGAGLGLALVNRFVELHDGWVELKSTPGEGTVVTCHLPRRSELNPAIREKPGAA
jgi:signal transduction histidine kinase